MNGDGPDGTARVAVADEHDAVPAGPYDRVDVTGDVDGQDGHTDLDDLDGVNGYYDLDNGEGYDDRHDVDGYPDGFGVDPTQQHGEPGPGVTVAHNDGQVAHTVYGGLHQYVQRVRDYHELSDDYVRDRLDGFVEPGYHDAVGVPLDSHAALRLMRHHGGVVLVGAPGTGRYTAALRLLHATGAQLREIRPTFDPGRAEQLTIAELPVAAGFAYLLELPEQAHHIQYGFARDLGGYCDSLARRGSSIAVVATDTTWAQLGALRDGPVLRVGTPPAGQVLDRRLRRLCPGLDLRWLVDEPQISELLTGAPPAEAVRLAQLAADVLTSSGALTGTGALAGTGAGITADSPLGKEVVSALLSAYHNWEAELTTWFHRHAESRQRAFLVATAALEGSNAGQVLGAAEALDLRLTGGQEPAGLRHAGARALVADVGAVFEDGTNVRFRRARYAQAVIDFVITDRADTFQRELWHWVCELPLRGGGAGGRVDRRLAARSAELVLSTALRRRTPEILSQVTAAWSHRSDLRAALVHVLGIAALSPEIGAAVRQRLYRWAQLRGRRKVLVTVAEVCGGQLADFYVDQALTRLGHLARHGLVEVDEAVLAALRSLWRRPALRQPVLLRLAAWLAGDHPQSAALAAVALDLLGQSDAPAPQRVDVDSGQLAGDDPDRTAAPADARPPDQILAQIVEATAATQDDIAVALGRALDRAQLPAALPTLLHRWFDDAATDPDLVDTLTHVLGRTVTAGPAAARRVARLRALLAAWPAAGDESGGPDRFDGLNASRRAALRRHLIHQLHRADPMTARRNSPPAQEP